MKTIDTKSLLLGFCMAILFLTLTGGKEPEEGYLQVSTGMNCTTVFNTKTKTIYGYFSKMNRIPRTQPDFTAKVLADGSRLTIESND